jgi:predicted HTH domain antitoxin
LRRNTHVVNIRLEDGLLAKLQKLAQLERTDRTSLMRSLLSRGADEVLAEKALMLYSKGELSIEQAAKLAGATSWEIISMMVERGINHAGTGEELRMDAKRRLGELGLKKLAAML